jgi:hypothetical protein
MASPLLPEWWNGRCGAGSIAIEANIEREAVMVRILLQWLPPLPEDLEYRLIDHDLVLWDSHADLILDVLPDAVGRPSS